MPHQIQHLVSMEPNTRRLRRRADRRLKLQRPSKAAEMWYRAQLFAIVGHLAMAGTAVAEELRPIWPRARAASDQASGDRGTMVALAMQVDPTWRPRALDADPPRLESILARAAAKFGGIKQAAEVRADGAARRNLSAVDAQLASSVRRSIGLDISNVLRPGRRIQEKFEQATVENVALITSMPGKYLAKVHDVVVENWTAGQRWEEMVDDIARAGRIAKNRANVIARDQTSKMTAAFNEARQLSIGIRRYIWRDCGIYTGKHRVRPSHQAMNGQVCEWAHPPEVDGEHVHPGEAILCRCLGEPIVNLDLLEADVDEAQAA